MQVQPRISGKKTQALKAAEILHLYCLPFSPASFLTDTKCSFLILFSFDISIQGMTLEQLNTTHV